MIDARGRNGRAARGLGQNEGSLQDRLGMQRQALSGPGDAQPIVLHRLRNIRFNRGSVSAEACLTRLANLRVRAIDLLHQRAEKTGELGDFALEELLAKIEVAQDPMERIAVLLVRRAAEKDRWCVGPVVRRSDRKRLLALEMVKECALGDAGLDTKLIDRRRRIAFL